GLMWGIAAVANGIQPVILGYVFDSTGSYGWGLLYCEACVFLVAVCFFALPRACPRWNRARSPRPLARRKASERKAVGVKFLFTGASGRTSMKMIDNLLGRGVPASDLILVSRSPERNE